MKTIRAAGASGALAIDRADACAGDGRFVFQPEGLIV